MKWKQVFFELEVASSSEWHVISLKCKHQKHQFTLCPFCLIFSFFFFAIIALDKSYHTLLILSNKLADNSFLVTLTCCSSASSCPDSGAHIFLLEVLRVYSLIWKRIAPEDRSVG